MSKLEIRWVLIVAALGATGLTYGGMQYGNVVDNSHASGIATALFCVAWFGGVGVGCFVSSFTATRLVAAAFDRRLDR
jgi:hypothetical protein